MSRCVEIGIVERIVDVAEAGGIPVIGTTPYTAMESEPPGHRPRNFLKGARSLLCFGLPAPDAVYFAVSHRAEIIWRS
jgi:hypothetical protein